MEVTSSQQLPIRRLSRAEYHYIWENYLCIGCDGKLTPGHKCPKILVWIENEDEGDDESCDEELTVESEESSKAGAEIEVPEEQNLFDEMSNPTEEENNRAKAADTQMKSGNIIKFEVIPCEIESKCELATRENCVSACIDEVETYFVKEIEYCSSFENEKIFPGENLEDESVLMGYVHDRGKELLVCDGWKGMGDAEIGVEGDSFINEANILDGWRLFDEMSKTKMEKEGLTEMVESKVEVMDKHNALEGNALGDKPMMVVNHMGEEKQLAAEEISSTVSMKMRKIVEVNFCFTVKNNVVAVPTHFSDSLCQTTKDAGVIFDVMCITKQPTVADIVCGFDKKATRVDEKANDVVHGLQFRNVFDGGTKPNRLFGFDNDLNRDANSDRFMQGSKERRGLVPVSFVFVASMTKQNHNQSAPGYCINFFVELLKLVSYEVPFRFKPFGDGLKILNYDELVRMVTNEDFDATVRDCFDKRLWHNGLLKSDLIYEVMTEMKEIEVGSPFKNEEFCPVTILDDVSGFVYDRGRDELGFDGEKNERKKSAGLFNTRVTEPCSPSAYELTKTASAPNVFMLFSSNEGISVLKVAFVEKIGLISNTCLGDSGDKELKSGHIEKPSSIGSNSAHCLSKKSTLELLGIHRVIGLSSSLDEVVLDDYENEVHQVEFKESASKKLNWLNFIPMNFLPRGSINLGNLCFLNATIQALLSCFLIFELLHELRNCDILEIDGFKKKETRDSENSVLIFDPGGGLHLKSVKVVEEFVPQLVKKQLSGIDSCVNNNLTWAEVVLGFQHYLRFEQTMTATQAALMVASAFPLMLGFLGIWRIIVRFVGPLFAFLDDNNCKKGIRPNEFTFAGVLNACAQQTTKELGRLVQGHMMRTGFNQYSFAASALAHTYTQCGSVERADKMFKLLPRPDLFSWTSLINGYAQNGQPHEALKLFDRLLRSDNRPNHVTSVPLLPETFASLLECLGEKIIWIFDPGGESDISTATLCSRLEDATATLCSRLEDATATLCSRLEDDVLISLASLPTLRTRWFTRGEE